MSNHNSVTIAFNHKDADNLVAAYICAIWAKTVPKVMYNLVRRDDVPKVDHSGHDVIYIGKLPDRTELLSVIAKANSAIYIGNHAKSLSLCTELNTIESNEPIVTVYKDPELCLSGITWRLLYPDFPCFPYVIDYLQQHVTGHGILPSKKSVIAAIKALPKRVSTFRDLLAYSSEQMAELITQGDIILEQYNRMAQDIVSGGSVQDFLGYRVLVAAVPEDLVPQATSCLRNEKPFAVIYTDFEGYRTYRLFGSVPNTSLLDIASKIGEPRGNGIYAMVRVKLPSIV